MNAYLVQNVFRFLLLLSFVAVAFVSFSQDVELRTQADVDAFDPSTTEIFGTLLLGEQSVGISDIVDISNLSNIERVYDDLIISRNIDLLNVDELSNLARIGGYLSVTTNENLLNIDGLSSLVRMGFKQDLIIFENTRLQNIDGLSNLTAHVDILRIYNNFSLLNLDGLSNIETIEEIEIEDNVGLVSIRGFEGLTDIEGATFIKGNTNLFDLSGFDNLDSFGSFRIFENPSLTNINIFTKKDTLFGSVSIFRNDALTNIVGFDSLKHVTGTLLISGNEELVSIDGIKNVISVGGDFGVSNSKLDNIDALRNLVSVGNIMRVLSNSNLDNCCPIKNLVKNRETTIGDSLYIGSNYCGCNSVEEVVKNGCDMRLVVATSPSCIGEENGSIQIFANQYDVVPFSYSWLREEDSVEGSGVSLVDAFTIDMLSAGTYNITVTTPSPDTVIKLDVLLLEEDGSFFEVIEINSGNSSNGLSNGSVSITTSGGVGPYTYSWTGENSGFVSSINSSAYTIEGLKYGEYSITIIDALDFSVTIEITLLDDQVEVIMCEEPLDIVILNDVSGSVDANEYRASQKFFVDFLQKVNIGMGESDSRASIIEWSTGQELRIPLTDDISVLESYIFMNRSFEGNTAPHQAMSFARSYLDANVRDGVEKVMILATDGSGSQISSSLVALADQLKANGYHIITIAFDEAYNDINTREKLRDISSIGVLAPGAASYSGLNENLAEDIVGIFLCPIDPGDFASAYFTRDGELEIVNVALEGNCPFPNFVEVTINVSAFRELSIPAGMPITFYHNNPNQAGATSILTWHVPCAIPIGTSETFTILVPINSPTNLFAVLNDDGQFNPPISFPITSIGEIAYSNNIDNERICADGTATIQAFKYSSLPIPACDTMVNYTINVCNVSEVEAFGVIVNDIAPSGFLLTGSVFNDNGCATNLGGSYNIPTDCCISIFLTYDASAASNGYYGNQGVELDGPAAQTYINFDGSTTTDEDVTIDGTIDCPSAVIEFTKSVNIFETCDDAFVEFTFTINNEMNIPLQGLTFSDILPDPCTWVFMPYGLEGLIIENTFFSSNEAIFTINEVAANTIATFHMDASLNSWDNDGILNNTASLDNVPDLINGGLTTLTSNTTTTLVTASPIITLPDTIIVNIATDTINLNTLLSGEIDVFWTTEGDGLFLDNTAINAYYLVGVQDSLDGAVSLFVSAVSDCNQTGASVYIQFVDCSLEVEIIEIGECDNMDTPTDESDDTYEITFLVDGNNTGLSSMFVVAVGSFVDTLTYNTEHVISVPANGIVDVITYADLEFGYCETEIEVFQESCNVECTIIGAIEDIALYDCNDNGTPQDSTDDYYLVEFTVVANNPTTDSTFSTVYNGLEVGPFVYGELATLSLSADSVVDSILVLYSNFEYCSVWLVANQENCYVEEECFEELSSVIIEENIIEDCEIFEANLTAITNVSDSIELTYVWTDVNDVVLGDENNLEVDETGIYTVSVSYCGENIIESIQLISDPILVLEWPKVFFPNGMEDENRTFGPYNECDVLVTDYSLKIFNRWGNEVFSSEDVTFEWDGQHDGSESASAVYVYVVEYTLNGSKQPVRKGDVTLLRN